jgi:RHS repeat-associated protein
MLSDGTNAFTWNARNQVAKLNNVSLQYDAFGRRIQNAAGTSFFYDGANAAQELSGTTVTANLLSGGIDEVFSRTDSSGAFTPLKDALGSTIALVDSSGNIQTSYTYDPYGGTSVTGTSNGNEFQYTGRESEGNGLYFYRARYYSPLLHRFISEDPLGFAGSGPNFYAYVLDSPTNFSDPLGLEVGTAPPPTDVNPTPAQIQQALQEVERASATAEVGTTTAAVATTATTTGSGPVMTLVAGGSAEGVGAGPVGVVVGAGAATLGGYGYYMGQAISAVQSANAADQELLQAIHNLNQVLLAGRKDENSGGLKPCKLVGELELPSGQVSCSYKCGHWPGALFPATCDPGQKCKAEIPGGWVSKETACE